MSPEQMQDLVTDWAERVAVQVMARIRAENPAAFDDTEQIDSEAVEAMSRAAFAGAATGLESVAKVVSLDMDTLLRIARETP